MEPDGWELQGSPRRKGGRNSPNPTNRSFSEVARQGAQQGTSRLSNANRAMGPNPDLLHRHTHPVYRVRNEGAFRDEVEVEIRTVNGEPFRGSLTRLEAKHLIYKGILGCPFSNFRGCKLGFKACPTVTFMLKEQINIDDLEFAKEFSFKRSYMKQGRLVEDILEGRVRGVRTVTGSKAMASYSDDWTRVVKVEGCDYRVEPEMILKWLGKFGEVKSDLVEDVFEDGEDSEGENATGIYSVKVKLNHNIPQLLPMDGKRVKIYYRGIQKLCTKCFGGHLSRNCSEEKIPWLSYVRRFVDSNTDFDDEMFGNWLQILEREQRQKRIDKDHFDGKNQPPKETEIEDHHQTQSQQVQTTVNEAALIRQGSENEQEKEGDIPQTSTDPQAPKPGDFNVPLNREEWDELVDKLLALGLTRKDANASIEKRRKQFTKALEDYNNGGKLSSKKGRPKSRKSSINDIQH